MRAAAGEVREEDGPVRRPSQTLVMKAGEMRRLIEEEQAKSAGKERDSVPPPAVQAQLVDAQIHHGTVECPGCGGIGRVTERMAARISLAVPHEVPPEPVTQTKIKVEDDDEKE